MDKKTLETVQNAKFPDTPEGRILADSQKKIGDITDNFTNPGNISTTKIDLTKTVEDAGLTVQQYESVFGSIKRSEADAVQYIADQATQTKPETPKPQPKTDNGGKKDKKEQKDKPKKNQRPKKNQVGESPKWLKTLESFVKSFAGKTKDTWRVRNFITDIQAYFSKNHGKQTPNIELIREIQDKLIKYANSDDRKVTIPAYDDLVSKCKKAIRDKDITVSNKAKKPEIKPKELSGFTIGFSKKKK